jgi:hypothetical protein
MGGINNEPNLDDRNTWMSRETMTQNDADIAVSKHATFSSHSSGHKSDDDIIPTSSSYPLPPHSGPLPFPQNIATTASTYHGSSKSTTSNVCSPTVIRSSSTTWPSQTAAPLEYTSMHKYDFKNIDQATVNMP